RARAAVLDPPGQGEVAGIVGRAPALLAARATARADRLAAAHLVVRTGHAPVREIDGGHDVALQIKMAAPAAQAAPPDQTTARRHGSTFSATTNTVSAAPHTTFMMPTANSTAISIQQQPMQKTPCRRPIRTAPFRPSRHSVMK